MAEDGDPLMESSWQTHYRDKFNENLTMYTTGGGAAQSSLMNLTDFDGNQLTPMEMQHGATPGHLAHSCSQAHEFDSCHNIQSMPTYSRAAFALYDQESHRYMFESLPTLPDSNKSSCANPNTQVDPWSALSATVPAHPGLDVADNRALTSSGFESSFIKGYSQPSFRDSGIGTASAESAHETESILSSSQQTMDHSYISAEQQSSQFRAYEDAFDAVNLSMNPYNSVAQQDTNSVMETNFPVDPLDPLRCPFPTCKEPVKTPSDLKKHRNRHLRIYTCSVAECTKYKEGFGTPNDLERHMKTVHKRWSKHLKDYRCFNPACVHKDKTFGRLDNFKDHIKRAHPSDDIEDLVTRSNTWYDHLPRQDDGLSTSPGINAALHPSTPASERVFNDHATRASSARKGRTQSMRSPLIVNVHHNQPKKTVQPGQSNFLSPDAARAGRRATISGQQDRYHPYSVSISRSQSDVRNSTLTHYQLSGLYGTIDERNNVSEQYLMSQPSFTRQNTDLIGNSSYSYPNGFYDVLPETQKAYTAPDLYRGFNEERHDLIHQPPVTPQYDSIDLNNADDYVMFAHGRDTDVDSSPIALDNFQAMASHPPPTEIDQSRLKPDTPKVNSRGMLEELKSLVANYETKDREGLLDENQLQETLQLFMKSSRSSSSGSGRRPKTRATSRASSRVGKRPKSSGSCKCSHDDCDKTFARQSTLKKHLMRHTRPFACAYEYTCTKAFGSKDDWKRHEEAQHKQEQCFRCDGEHYTEDRMRCYKVFYVDKKQYSAHLRQCGVPCSTINRLAEDRRIPVRNDGRFWCGFCEAIIPLLKHGADALKARLDHIALHYLDENKDIDQWIELGGEGSSRAQMRKKKPSRRASTQTNSGSDKEDQHDGSSISPDPTSPSSESNLSSATTDQFSYTERTLFTVTSASYTHNQEERPQHQTHQHDSESMPPPRHRYVRQNSQSLSPQSTMSSSPLPSSERVMPAAPSATTNTAKSDGAEYINDSTNSGVVASNRRRVRGFECCQCIAHSLWSLSSGRCVCEHNFCQSCRGY